MYGYIPGLFKIFSADMMQLGFILICAFIIGGFCAGLARKNKTLWFLMGFTFNLYGLFLLMILYNSHLKIWHDSITGPQYNNPNFE